MNVALRTPDILSHLLAELATDADGSESGVLPPNDLVSVLLVCKRWEPIARNLLWSRYGKWSHFVDLASTFNPYPGLHLVIGPTSAGLTSTDSSIAL